MIYPIYSKKRCRRRDQIGMYDDSGYVYKGRKLTPEGQPEEGSLAGRFDRQGRVWRDLYQQKLAGELRESGLVYAIHPATGERVEGLADGQGCGWKGVAHDVLAVCIPQGAQRQQAAAAALLLLRGDLPADAEAKSRFENLPAWLETLLDLVLDAAELILDIVT